MHGIFPPKHCNTLFFVSMWVTLGSGTAVRPNSKLSQLTPGPNLNHMFNDFTDWRSSMRDQIPQPGPAPVKPLHWLKMFNKRSKILLCGWKHDCMKRAKKGFGKTNFRRPLQHFQIAKPSSTTRNKLSRHVETECTGNTTILALCQDVRHCMLGKRELLAVTLPLPYPYIYIKKYIYIVHMLLWTICHPCLHYYHYQ